MKVVLVVCLMFLYVSVLRSRLLSKLRMWMQCRRCRCRTSPSRRAVDPCRCRITTSRCASAWTARRWRVVRWSTPARRASTATAPQRQQPAAPWEAPGRLCRPPPPAPSNWSPTDFSSCSQWRHRRRWRHVEMWWKCQLLGRARRATCINQSTSIIFSSFVRQFYRCVCKSASWTYSPTSYWLVVWRKLHSRLPQDEATRR